MTYDDRRRRGRTICASLVDDIGKVGTPGRGLWPEAWDVVGEESAAFMEALLRWEETGDPNLINRLKELYDRVVSSWRDAAGLYELKSRGEKR